MLVAEPICINCKIIKNVDIWQNIQKMLKVVVLILYYI